MERGMEGEKERVVEKRKIRGGWRVRRVKGRRVRRRISGRRLRGTKRGK